MLQCILTVLTYTDRLNILIYNNATKEVIK
jgi:hypothetical protein